MRTIDKICVCEDCGKIFTVDNDIQDLEIPCPDCGSYYTLIPDDEQLQGEKK